MRNRRLAGLAGVAACSLISLAASAGPIAGAGAASWPSPGTFLVARAAPSAAATQSTAVLRPHTVITSISGTLLASNVKDQRLIEAGVDLTATRQINPVSNIFAVIDTRSYNVLSRVTTTGSIGGVTIDEDRWLAYVAVDTAVALSPSDPYTSYHLELWVVNLRTGRVVNKVLVFEGGPITVSGIAIDSAANRVVLATSQNDATNDLLVVDPVSQSLHLASLEGVPNDLFMDAQAHRAIVALQMATPAPGSSRFVALDTRTAHRTWYRGFPYRLRAFSVTYSARRQQIWYAAPGGLITIFNAGTGKLNKQIQMSYTTATGLGDATGFVVDTTRNVGYLRWVAGNYCSVDAAIQSNGTRGVIYQDHFSSCFNVYSDYVLAMAVNEATGTVEMAGQTGITLLSTRGKVLSQTAITPRTGIGTSQTSAPVALMQSGKHSTLVLFRTVSRIDVNTGAPTSGAVVFLQVL